MAFMNLVSMFLATAVEAATLIWMELAMFGMAALVYILCMRGSSLSASREAKVISKAVKVESSKTQPTETLEDHKIIFEAWLDFKTQGDASDINLASVVHSMQK